MNFLKLVRKLKENLFGKELSEKDTRSPKKTFPSHETDDAEPRFIRRKTAEQRDPYYFQIGFDFGTSYSKCICRDVMIEKAWVHISDRCSDQEFPFLLPGVIIYKDKKFRLAEDPQCHYPENGLYHLKNALVMAALNQWDDPVLVPYKQAIGLTDREALGNFIELCGVYFLGTSIGEVRKNIRKRYPEFGLHPEDYMAINLAVPVADAERPQVNALYEKILTEAWYLADRIDGNNEIALADLKALRNEKDEKECRRGGEACLIYPEVSANVQGFVRSRVSAPGVYLFSDTGASTVDQGIFIFIRKEDVEYLTYLYASVLPLGSSQVELRAMANSGEMNMQALETMREMKEFGESTPEIKRAQESISEELNRGTIKTLAGARKKLYVREQLNGARIIFGGGGHCDYPYKTAVMRSFSAEIFREPLQPDIINLPVPNDLEINQTEARWMKRLSVAYGLSFERHQLAHFTYPRDLREPRPEEVWPPRKPIPDPPEND